MEINESIKAALVELGLKEGATLTEVRAEYLDKTSQYKFQHVLDVDDEALQKEFSRLYKAYVNLVKHYSQTGSDEDSYMDFYPPDQVFQFHFNQGVYYFINQKYLQAGERFQEAFKINNKDLTLLLYLGALLLKRKSYYAAEKYFKDVVKIDPNNDDGWYYLGESYFRAGELRKATSMYETAKALNPQRSEIAFRLKEIREQMPRPQAPAKKESFLSRIKKKLTGQ